ncbi:MAG: T9SS type A sorting domain-containing protein [Bacteroidia bacterium]
MAPDDKIYFATNWYDGINFPFPYPDTAFNIYNTYLGVINAPDSLGDSCNFQPYSFYLGGNRSYAGLPNNPDYDLPRDSGSVCDTIQWTGIQSPAVLQGGVLFVTYVNSWDKLFINAQHLKGSTYTLRVTDITGRLVFKEKGSASAALNMPGNGYFTKDLDCSGFSNGMYIINLTTNKEMLSQKFIKN